MLDRDSAQKLCARVLALSRAEAARVSIDDSSRGFTRYAVNRITSAGASDDTGVSVTSVFGKRLATVTTNRLDDTSLEEAVRRSEALAKLAPENPEYMGELGAQKYVAVPQPQGVAGMAHDGDARAAGGGGGARRRPRGRGDRRRLRRHPRDRARDGQHQGLVRVSRRRGRRAHADDAQHGRRRLGLGRRRSDGDEPARQRAHHARRGREVSGRSRRRAISSRAATP